MGNWLGNSYNEQWESGEISEDDPPPPGIWDSRPPTVAPESCSKHPDISSIFELSFQRGEYFSSLEQRLSAISCLLENTYLAWHNGEPLEEEQREAGDHSWCEAKCKANPECGGWTFNKNNGWCALKRSDQIKKEKKENFISGIKKC